MGLFNEIKNSVASYYEATQFIRIHKLKNLLLLSLLFYFALAILSGFIIWFGMDMLGDYLTNLNWVQSKLKWFTNFEWIMTATQIGLFLSGMFVYLSIYKFIFLAIASPLYAYISERTGELITNRTFKFELGQFIKDILRGIFISGINLIRQLLFTFIMILFSFIPVIGWLFNIIIIFIDSYYYGFSMIDYNCERHKMSVSESRAYISERKGMAIGNGIIAYFSLFIPVLGIVFIAPLSAIAASIHFYKNQTNE